MKKRIIIVIVLLFMVLGLLVALFLLEPANDDQRATQFYTTEEETYAIETPYCNLYYPLKWKEQIEIETVDKDNSYYVKLYAIIDDDKISLFDICFNCEEGSMLGILTENETAVTINIVNYENDLSMYTEKEQNMVYDMIEAINVLIAKLIEYDNFELV